MESFFVIQCKKKQPLFAWKSESRKDLQRRKKLSFAAASPDQKTTMMIRSMAYNIW
jgi:hypothetical protein